MTAPRKWVYLSKRVLSPELQECMDPNEGSALLRAHAADEPSGLRCVAAARPSLLLLFNMSSLQRAHDGAFFFSSTRTVCPVCVPAPPGVFLPVGSSV